MTPLSIHTKENKMETEAEKPTFIEKIKENKKVILGRALVIGGTLLGIAAAAALFTKIRQDEETNEIPELEGSHFEPETP